MTGAAKTICIVVRPQSGPADGEPAFAFADAAARGLALQGHRVTMLCLRPAADTLLRLQAECAGSGIAVVPLVPADDAPFDAAEFSKDSYQVYGWLKGRAFDIVSFPETAGLGYYSLVAKQEGLCFQDAVLCVGLCGPILRKAALASRWIDSPVLLLQDFVERRSAELADLVVAWDSDVADWTRDHGWLTRGPLRTVPPTAASDWPASLAGIIAGFEPAAQVSRPAAAEPFISVCIAHYNRPDMLKQAMASIAAQDYKHFEVVIVDDGSTNPRSRQYLDETEATWRHRPLRVVHQENRYLGAARNAAVKEARGEYVLIMDDDNLMMPGQISTYARAAVCSGADILTSPMQSFRGQEPPASDAKPRSRFLPVGGALGVGFFINVFGDANALIRKSAFEAVGGFTEDRGLSYEDWELFSKALLAGFRLEVVPETLQWYRETENSVVRSTSRHRNILRISRPYLAALPGHFADLLMLARGMWERQIDENKRVNRPAPHVELLSLVPAMLERGDIESGLALMRSARILAERDGDHETAARIARSILQLGAVTASSL